MKYFQDELENILENDPLGLLKVRAKAASAQTADELLQSAFREINDFVRESGSEPTAGREVRERKLYSRLKGLRSDPDKAMALEQFDEFGLLADSIERFKRELESVEDVIEVDPLGLLDDDEVDIYSLKHVPKFQKKPDHVARRKACKEFDKFEPLFKEVHDGLKAKTHTTTRFKGETQIKKGAFFLLKGMLVYVANVGEWQDRGNANKDARLYLVFENGTESNMLVRSFGARLWTDENSRQIISADQVELFERESGVSESDASTGFIYVLRSLSQNSEIAAISDLYKIGFSTHPVDERVQGALQEAAYLFSDVEVVSIFQTYNLNPQKMEALLHRFFAESCLNLDVFDEAGKRYSPREWFVVPLEVIEQAIYLLISGDIVNFHYDIDKQCIQEKS